MTRSSELTRRSLIDAATKVFARSGYERASVREITRLARANPASIAYHFGGKEALYREVLSAALAAIQSAIADDGQPGSDGDRTTELRRFIHRLLAPLLARDALALPMRIFGWESVSPTAVYVEFLSASALPMVRRAEGIVRQFARPDASREEVSVATIWLLQQGAYFIRHADLLALPPSNLKVDKAYVERLGTQLSRMAEAGLSALAA